MKRWIFSLAVAGGLLFLAQPAAAQMMRGFGGMGTMMPGQGPHRPMMPMMMGHGMGMFPLPLVFERAEAMAEGETLQRVRTLKDQYLEKFLRQRTEVQIAHWKARELMSDPRASEQDLRKAHENLWAQQKSLQGLCLQAMLDLRKALGPEKFAGLMKEVPMPGMRRGMMPTMQ